MRTDPDAANLYLQQYLKATQPDGWSQQLAAVPLPTDSAPSEKWLFYNTKKRPGEDGVTSTLSEYLDPASDSAPEGGVIAAVSPLSVKGAIDQQVGKPDVNRLNIYQVQLRNGSGEWVSATPASITAGLAAGAGSPLGGATSAATGAWPLTWVNHLYAPSSGLSPDQANSLATIIRWQATVGAAGSALLLDGRLPDTLLHQALTAADQLVQSNCTAAKGTVVTSTDPGPFAPAGTLTGIGPMKLCRGAGATATRQRRIRRVGTGLDHRRSTRPHQRRGLGSVRQHDPVQLAGRPTAVSHREPMGVPSRRWLVTTWSHRTDRGPTRPVAVQERPPRRR